MSRSLLKISGDLPVIGQMMLEMLYDSTYVYYVEACDTFNVCANIAKIVWSYVMSYPTDAETRSELCTVYTNTPENAGRFWSCYCPATRCIEWKLYYGGPYVI